MSDTTHYGNDQMGAATLHRGRRENCPAPECQDALTEQPEPLTHCVMCGHPAEAHDLDADGNRPCRTPGHPKGVPCAECRALLTTEYRERIQDERKKPGFDEAWHAYLITRDDAQQSFGKHAPAFFTDIHQSALASALIAVREHAAQPEPADRAWGAVWLHGNWEWLTRKMDTAAREEAADAVLRWSRALDAADGRKDREEPDGLRWWRE